MNERDKRTKPGGNWHGRAVLSVPSDAQDHQHARLRGMQAAVASLDPSLRRFLCATFDRLRDVEAVNHWLASRCGVAPFFEDAAAVALATAALRMPVPALVDAPRRDFGDYQTPLRLAHQICATLTQAGFTPTCLVEPTFGQGALIRAALAHFPSLEHVYGVEIHEPHVWFAKFALLEQALHSPEAPNCTIKLIQADAFTFDFGDVAQASLGPYLILGNPPWVTSAALSRLESTNKPHTSNFKQRKGLDALTGKSNFDISEHLVWRLLKAFIGSDAQLALLLKNQVIQTLLADLPGRSYGLADLKALRIDTLRHFEAAVEASLCVATLNDTAAEPVCTVAHLNTPNEIERRFGWRSGYFVSDVAAYTLAGHLEGRSPLSWRQGLKHDCARLMELTVRDGVYVNGLGEELDLEHAPIYPLAKGADLQTAVLQATRKSVIVTQTRLGEDTVQSLAGYPKLRSYLHTHRAAFERRKSVIYKNKPAFSLFGIGPYAFAPYKVAISGLYKEPHFALLLPLNNKPVMADDTCYYLGFTAFGPALFTWASLNQPPVKQFLQATAFRAAKRPYTKALLMRLDLTALVQALDSDAIFSFIQGTCPALLNDVSLTDWFAYQRSFPDFDAVAQTRHPSLTATDLTRPASIPVPSYT